MPILDVREIMKILPHRYPMLLIDRITELEPMVRARGYKNVTVNEPMLSGHFPGNPLFPGVYMIEALAQLGGTTILEPGDMARKVPYLAGIDKAKFRRPVVPGDRLDMEARVIKHKLNIGWVAVDGTVDGKAVVSAELTFSISIDPSAFAFDARVLHL
ncbi:MAG: beta-hydroxyacyl-(acyl-carrier-protein) dehydratase FabZ [Candidatus Eremiobacteraeota bacterium]|nr:beta-hydroxyacyl-(acyl-carrier-protein) dehydratase FabZ [Candidatus Eremiobacteraeota bacterium]